MTTVRGGIPTKPVIRNVDGYEVERRIVRTLEGRETFTAFDGTGVINTDNVAVAAITNESAAFTAADLNVSTTETTIQTVSYTTTGETLEVRANFYLSVLHEAGGGIDATIRLYRGATEIYEQTFSAIDDDVLVGWQTPIVIETPAAGTYTFTATVQTSVNTFDFAVASSRLLSVREFKR
jgi:hypothetical protein